LSESERESWEISKAKVGVIFAVYLYVLEKSDFFQLCQKKMMKKIERNNISQFQQKKSTFLLFNAEISRIKLSVGV